MYDFLIKSDKHYRVSHKNFDSLITTDVQLWLERHDIDPVYLIRCWRVGDKSTVLKFPTCQNCGNQLRMDSYIVRKFCSKECAGSDKVRRDLATQTFLMKYGCSHPWANESVRDKIRTTNLSIYGSEVAAKNNDVKLRMKRTIQNRYGTDSYTQTSEFKKKALETIQENYGVHNAAQSDEIIRKRTLSRRSTSFDAFKRELSKHNLTYVGDLQTYINVEDITYTCNVCGNQYTVPRTLACRIYCPGCSYTARSTKEKDLGMWLESVYKQDIHYNNRTVMGGLELDMYLPKASIAIEFNGIFWHSTAVLEDELYHFNKSNICDTQNISLIHVNENDWDVRKNLVQSFILGQLGINTHIVKADDCEIRILNDSETYHNFVKDNCLRRFDVSGVVLGFYYETLLIGCAVVKDNCIFNFIERVNYTIEYSLKKVAQFLNLQNISVAYARDYPNVRELGRYKISNERVERSYITIQQYDQTQDALEYCLGLPVEDKDRYYVICDSGYKIVDIILD